MHFLRLINIVLGFLLGLYWSLTLLCPMCTQGLPTSDRQNYRPCSAICPSLNDVPVAFLLRNYSLPESGARDRGSSPLRRYKAVDSFKIFVVLLLLSGDIELNPGPAIAQANPLLKYSQFNSRSVLGTAAEDKPALIQNYILENHVDILALSETWLRPDSLQATINSLTPDGYGCMHVPRQEGRGGGVAFIYRSSFEFRIMKVPLFASFECIVGKLIGKSASVILANVYRPPSASVGVFIDEFSSLLEDIGTDPSEIFISGDFNLHVDEPDSTIIRFLNLLEMFNLQQLITFPTHEAGHILDLFITRDNYVHNVSNFLASLVTSSDHMAVSCDIAIPTTTRPAYTTKRLRLFKNFSASAFTKDLLESGLNYLSDVELDLHTNAFMSTVKSILDRHAPWKTVKCSVKVNQPFFTRELRAQKRLKSRFESKWRKNKTTENWINYKREVKHFTVMLRDARRSYYRTLIDKQSSNSRKLWTTLHNVIGNSSVKVLPSSVSGITLAKSFLEFFNNKIVKLSMSFKGHVCNVIEEPVNPPPVLLNFEPTTETEVRQVILSMSDASCDLDVIPTKRLKECIDGFTKPITSLVNKCFQVGQFPTAFKQAIVAPLIKKPSLPKEELSSYRPVSHLNFISKVIEKIMQKRILGHLDTFGGLPEYQSAYRMYHSTETALLKVQNDLLVAIENQKVSALALLDLSAAFDTVDHTVLIDRLERFFGLKESALSLVKSYLTNRQQSVQVGEQLSPPVVLTTGVPQGSILGPLLFSLYTAPLEQTLSTDGVNFHFYADDTQIYMSFFAANCAESLTRLSQVLSKVHEWFTRNKLSLNPDKTEYILIGTQQQRIKIKDQDNRLLFGGCNIEPSKVVRNLGFYIDSDLSLRNHVSKVCQVSFMHIRNFRRIRNSLDLNSAKLLANALVTSRLDYCNGLLYGINKGLSKKLQMVQNSLARVVIPSVKRRDHITPVLRQLHWLPVEQRIIFKMAVLTFKVLKNSQPVYLSNLLKHRKSFGRRSLDTNLLEIPFMKSENGRRSFANAAPRIWNSLPQEIRGCKTENLFRKKLKTHLFPT